MDLVNVFVTVKKKNMLLVQRLPLLEYDRGAVNFSKVHSVENVCNYSTNAN